MGHPEHERQRQDLLDLDDVRVDQCDQDKRGYHLDALGPEQEIPAIVAIGSNPADQHEEQKRQPTQKGVEAHIECRAGQREHQQLLGESLRPRAGGRREGTEPERAEVTISKGAPEAPQQMVAKRWGGNVGVRGANEWFGS